MTNRLLGRIVGLLFGLFAAFPVSAEPAIAVEAADGAEGSVAVLSGLDPQVTYWITLVPPDEEDGAFGPFEYLTGQEQARIAFEAPAAPAEWRLHLADGENPVVARILQPGDAPAAPGAAPVDPVLAEFAARYGMAGRWSGGFVCDFGRAAVALDLGPDRSSPGRDDMIGTMSVEMIDGPYAGGSGLGPIKVTRAEGAAAVGLAPQQVINAGAGPYTLSQFHSLTLSEDGLRMQGDGPRLPGCKDFVLDRAPLPSEDAALAAVDALAVEGFAGVWEGSYDCGLVSSLELRFAPDPVLRTPMAAWVYSGQGYAGQHDFEVRPAGAKQALLQPLHWAQRPRGHFVTPVRLRLTPDGRAIQGSIEGALADRCAPFTLQRRPEAGQGTTAGASVDLASLTGPWEGLGRCGGSDAIVRLDVPMPADATQAGTVRAIPVSGPGRLRTPDRVRLIPRTGGRLSLRGDAQTSGAAAPSVRPSDVQVVEAGLRMTFEAGCEPLALSRPAVAGPPRGVLPAAQDAATALSIDEAGNLRVAQDDRLCSALAAWSGRLTGAERAIEPGEGASSGAWADLFTDPLFSAAFGVDFTDVAQTAALGERLVSAAGPACAAARGIDEAARMALTRAFALDGQPADPFGTDAHRFAAAIELAAPGVGQAVDLIDRIEALDPLDSRARARLRTEMDRMRFPHGDLHARAEAAIEAKDAEAVLAEARATLQALVDGSTPATRQALLDAEDALDRLPEDRVAEWRDRLTPAAQAVADAIVAGDDAAAIADLYAGLSAYPAITERIEAIAQMAAAERARRDALAAAERDRLLASVEGADTIAALHRLRPEVERVQQAGAADLGAAFDRRAAALLEAAVAALPPPPDPGQPGRSGPAIPGLNEGALIAAFLAGDPVVPYRRDRDETMIYIARLTALFREVCPTALPPDLPRLVTGEFVDLRAMTGSRDEMAAAGLSMLVEGLGALADPGAAMGRAMRIDEIHLAADGDGQLLLGALGCGNQDLRGMFSNIRSYVRDPSGGVPMDQRTLVDICRGASPGSGGYCACAAPQIEAASPALVRYLRAGPPAAWQHVATLDRRLGDRLRSCIR